MNSLSAVNVGVERVGRWILKDVSLDVSGDGVLAVLARNVRNVQSDAGHSITPSRKP